MVMKAFVLAYMALRGLGTNPAGNIVTVFLTASTSCVQWDWPPGSPQDCARTTTLYSAPLIWSAANYGC